MYIATNEMQQQCREVLHVLPNGIRRYMCNVNPDEATEMRLIIGKPFSIRYPDGDYYLTTKSVLSRSSSDAVTVTEGQLREMIERITKSSLYSVKEEIRNGYITIEGGHRVGLAGTAVIENGSVEFIRNISALNVRIAGEVIGAADEVIDAVTDGNMINNTLIVSPPCGGKTTILRDIARQLAYKGKCAAIADERCELAAMHNGRSRFDLGNNTVVLDNCPKDKAMLMLLRSMSPDVIITDEIGTLEDINAIHRTMNSGVAVIASIHGRDEKQIAKRRHIAEILPFFDVVIVLSKRNGVGTIEGIIHND